MQQPTVVAVIDDLFFQAKVGTALQQMGVAAQVVPNGRALQDGLRSGSAPALVIVDLTLRGADATALIRDLAGAAAREFGSRPGLWLARRRRGSQTGA